MAPAEAHSHRPVLLQEAITALEIQGDRCDGIFVDGTFGRGGHSRAILDRLGEQGMLLAMDRDPEAASVARQLADQDERFVFDRGPFSMLDRLIEGRHLQGKVDGLLLDLGVSSPQLDDPQRGFSFASTGPLDMRMDPDCGESAAQWLASAAVNDISRVLKDYGEERHARAIARGIVAAREQAPITTTTQLADIVAQHNASWEVKKHPATRTFQAIRIFINSELLQLRETLSRMLPMLAVGGRMVVISFHSLEDRIVKRFFRDQASGDSHPADMPITADQLQPAMRVIGKPIYASEQEIQQNPRSRSAVLRVAERLVS